VNRERCEQFHFTYQWENDHTAVPIDSYRGLLSTIPFDRFVVFVCMYIIISSIFVVDCIYIYVVLYLEVVNENMIPSNIM